MGYERLERLARRVGLTPRVASRVAAALIHLERTREDEELTWRALTDPHARAFLEALEPLEAALWTLLSGPGLLSSPFHSRAARSLLDDVESVTGELGRWLDAEGEHNTDADLARLASTCRAVAAGLAALMDRELLVSVPARPLELARLTFFALAEPRPSRLPQPARPPGRAITSSPHLTTGPPRSVVAAPKRTAEAA